MTQQAQNTSTNQVKIERILVSTDFSPLADQAVKIAKEFAEKYKAHITVVHVLEDPQYDDLSALRATYYGQDLLVKSEKRLEKIVNELREQGIEADQQIPTGVPYVEIVKLAQHIKADLIVISTHGRSGLQRALIGSTAERVVRTASCPVLSIRPPELSEG